MQWNSPILTDRRQVGRRSLAVHVSLPVQRSQCRKVEVCAVRADSRPRQPVAAARAGVCGPQGHYQAGRACADDEHIRVPGCVHLAHAGKSQRRPGFCLGGFVFPISCRRRGFKRVEQSSRRGLDFIDCTKEARFVSLGRTVKTTDLADKLQRGSANLIACHRRLEVEQRSDVSAHRDPTNPRRPLCLSRIGEWCLFLHRPHDLRWKDSASQRREHGVQSGSSIRRN